MVLCASGRQGMPHLFSGLIALGVAAAVLLGGGIVAVHLEHATIVSTAPELFPLKKQGLAFHPAAAHARSVLPLYGSPESVIPPLPERASIFFRTEPTGSQVAPAGSRAARFRPVARSRRFLRAVAARKSTECHTRVAGSFCGVQLHSPQDQANPAEPSGNARLVEAYFNRKRARERQWRGTDKGCDPERRKNPWSW